MGDKEVEVLFCQLILLSVCCVLDHDREEILLEGSGNNERTRKQEDTSHGRSWKDTKAQPKGEKFEVNVFLVRRYMTWSWDRLVEWQ